tara:strand:- start:113 stop:667 length:555 start_codon:yes stop_codon:yes gene_type:complete
MEAITKQISDLKDQLAQLEQLRIKEEQNNIKKALHQDTPIDINFNNIRIELFKRRFGYWKKVQDNDYNIEREAWKRIHASYDGFDEHYVSDFPLEIVSKFQNPPEFNFAHQEGFSGIGRRRVLGIHYRDNRTGNKITYHFTSTKNPHTSLQVPKSEGPVQDSTLESILFILEELTNRVGTLENN